jgi:hypothetical protein
MQSALAVIRQGVLAHLRIPANYTWVQAAAAPVSLQVLRGFADASFLDKKDVTDRVLEVVKNFDKVEASKVMDDGCVYAGQPIA